MEKGNVSKLLSMPIIRCPQNGFADGKLYGYLRDNANRMRHIVLVLFALVALCGLLPAVMAQQPASISTPSLAAMPEPAQSELITTPSMAAFLNDSWTPSTFAAPLASQASGVLKNMTRNNTTMASSDYAIYDFLKENYTSPAPVSPTFSAVSTPKGGKGDTIAWTGESIYQFLNDAWTPTAPIETFQQAPYKLHQMN
jgi:hypothetical protein